MIEATWLYLDRVTILIAAASAVLSGLAWMRSTELLKANRLSAQRRKALITIRLTAKVDGRLQSLDLPYKPRRDQLSRGELVGILGLYYGKERFDPEILRPVLESGDLNRVLEGQLDESSSDELIELEVDPSSFLRLQQRLASPPSSSPHAA